MTKPSLKRRLEVVAPVITKHLDELHMDTPEDEALLDEIRRHWRWALTGDRQYLPPRPTKRPRRLPTRPPTVLETPCRVWRGPLDLDGYGRIARNHRSWLLHRWVWQLTNGPIPGGMLVLHRCDNRPCFRLDHLQLGTVADNNADMAAKGRNRGPRKPYGPRKSPILVR